MASGTCLLPVCNLQGPHHTFRVQRITTLIQRSRERGDNDIQIKLQAILDAQGDQATVDCHKTCYCSYTCKTNVARHVAKKRKVGSSTDECESQTIRIRRSQLPTFQFDKHCLVCGKDCVPKDPRHPDRWERVIQCQTSDRPGRTPFKDVLLDICEQRNDDWSRKVEIRIKGALSDLPAADAQYHKKCYGDLIVIPKYTNLSPSSDVISDKTQQLIITDMYANQQVRTWTTIELYDTYCSLGRMLSRKQILNLTKHFL